MFNCGLYGGSILATQNPDRIKNMSNADQNTEENIRMRAYLLWARAPAWVLSTSTSLW